MRPTRSRVTDITGLPGGGSSAGCTTTRLRRPDSGRPAPGRRHYLRDLRDPCADPGRIPVPDGRRRRIRPPGRGRVDGRSSAHRAGARGAAHGAAAAMSRSRCPSLRPRPHYTSYESRETLPRDGGRRVDGFSGRVLRQRDGRELLRTLECDLIDRRKFPVRTEIRTASLEYIEGWHNPHHRHSGLGCRSPAGFERSRRQSARVPSAEPSTPTRNSTTILFPLSIMG